MGLMVGISASLELDFASLSIFSSLISCFMGKLRLLVTFHNQTLGLKMIYYASGKNDMLMTSVLPRNKHGHHDLKFLETSG